MFAQPPVSNRRWKASLVVSMMLHCVVIYFLVRPPRPIYVTPSQLAFGHGGTSTELIYLAQHGSAATQASEAKPERKRIALNRPAARTRPKPAPKASATENAKQTYDAAEPPRAGSPYGSLAQGPASGHDVRPALPVEFPSPAILPWQIPSGVQGTVIVEVTIDALGNVTETKVLKGLGHGIEEKVVAALRNWRFRPAMMDGRAIPSQQDVYFHFPS
jgi:periplasmic protein TonB